MKVLIIHTEYQDPGGEDVVVAQEFKLLSKAHEVRRIIFRNRRGICGFLQMILYPFNFFAAFKVLRVCLTFRPGVVHLHNLHYASGPLLIWVIAMLRIPMVMTLHNYRILCPTATLFYKGKAFRDSLSAKFPWKAVSEGVISHSVLKTFWVALTNYLHLRIGTYRTIDRFFALNGGQREEFEQAHPSVFRGKVLVKPNFCEGFDEGSLESGRSDHFLFVGRLSEEKGLRTLLEAFKDSGCNLKIAGAGPLEQELRQSAASFPNIEFLGALDRKQIGAELRRASALVFASVWPETFGLVIIEAFSCGTPVVASSVGAAQDLVKPGECGFLFEAGNVSELKFQLQQWSALSKERKAAMSLAAYQSWKHHFSPDEALKTLTQLYQQSIARKMEEA